MTKKKKDIENTEILSDEQKLPIVVGIGASAGGLEAIQSFFTNMPSGSNLAFVIVQHLSPDHKSLMNELLAKYTQMKILVASDGLMVEENNIYLIPPGKNMTIFHGKLFLTPIEKKKHINLPIDIFFRSLAKDKGKNSIAIILSGTGSDGTLGIRAIKEAGGMVMVQDDQSAKFDGMPRSSIATGIVDYVLPPGKMPEKMLSYIKHPYINKSKDFEEELNETEDALLKIIMMIRDHVGVDFSYYKPNTIIRRVEKRMGINQFEEIETYLDFIGNNKDEVEVLYKELLIGVTKFFRDREAYNFLEEKVIPGLFEGKDNNSEIRVWTVGCSTGEEAYSLAILFRQYMDKHKIYPDVKIFATDLDKDSIEFAGVGLYPENIYSDLTQEQVSEYFIKKDSYLQVNELIRRMVVFATQNITKDPPFSKIDFITCRNLLIYLKPETQKKILQMFYFALKEDGYLFLGSSESIADFPGFKSMNTKWKIFSYSKGYQPPLNENFSMRLTSHKDKFDYKDFQTHRKTPEAALSDGMIGQLLEKYLPPSVVIDEHYNVVHIVNDVNKLLKLPKGKLSFNLLKLISNDLAVIINSILRKVKKENREVAFDNVTVEEGRDEKFILNIRANKISDSRNKQHFFVISFDEQEDKKEKEQSPEKFDLKSQYHERMVEMEKELQFTKENLQATVEELETSNEELQSSNEELIASNEELQSTNEELQSVNEELYTVNAEHQDKIVQLTELNNDMSNLLTSTDIGTIFLDADLCIRKFTPKVQEVAPILEMDIGRPVKHLSVGSIYPDFIKDIEKVREALKIKEKEIKIKDNYWLVRILPYRTSNNAVEGIVITFIGINDLKKSQQTNERERELLYRVLDNSPVAKTMVDKNGHITFANAKAKELFKITDEEIKQRTYDDSKWEISNIENNPIAPENLPFSIVKNTLKSVKDYKHYISIDGGKKVLLLISGSPILEANGELKGAVFTLLDITKKYQEEQKIIESEKKYRKLFDSNFDPILVANTDRNIIEANKAFYKLFGYTEKEIAGKKTKMLYADETDFKEMAKLLKASKKNSVKNILYKKKNGDAFLGETSKFTIHDEKGNPKAYVGIIRDFKPDKEK